MQRVIVESLPRQFVVMPFQNIRITLHIEGGLPKVEESPLHGKDFVYTFQQFLGAKRFGHIVVNLGNV